MNRRALLALLPRALGAALLSRMGLSRAVAAQDARLPGDDPVTLMRSSGAWGVNAWGRVASATDDDRVLLASVFGPSPWRVSADGTAYVRDYAEGR